MGHQFCEREGISKSSPLQKGRVGRGSREHVMTEHFNKKEMQKRRRQLRANMTYCEKLVWLYLRKRQMKERFLRQYSVDNYVVDFYCPKLKLAIEVDGDIHDLQDQKKYDKDRQEYLENFGIQFVRVKNVKLLSNPDKEFQRIENEIQKLGNTKDVNKFLAP